ncbi:hypothetical protein [Aneurinibacillus thermoaerophilus]|nr:hypothetical protein [Aneurinibacillus thermoaerophilus]
MPAPLPLRWLYSPDGCAYVILVVATRAGVEPACPIGPKSQGIAL